MVCKVFVLPQKLESLHAHRRNHNQHKNPLHDLKGIQGIREGIMIHTSCTSRAMSYDLVSYKTRTIRLLRQRTFEHERLRDLSERFVIRIFGAVLFVP